MTRLTVAVAVCALLLLYQAYITYRVTMHLGLSRTQKLTQSLMIWLLPFLGAAVVHAMLRTDREIPISDDKDFVPQPPNDGP